MKKTVQTLAVGLAATMSFLPTTYASTTRKTSDATPHVVITVGHAKSLSQEQNAIFSLTKQIVKNPPHVSFDTPGFVRYVYSKININLPRTIRDQSRSGQKITHIAKLEKGDLVFCNLVDSGSDVSFVGIYLEKNTFAAVTTHGLMVIDMKSPYWSNTFRFGMRVI